MILYFLSLIFCLFSPPFSQHPMRPFPFHYFDQRNLGDFSKFFLKFSSFLLPFSKSHARIQLMNQLHMREWLSWWSTTLPRLGSRVRVPSRALIIKKKDIQKRISFFVMFKPARAETQRSPLRSGCRKANVHWTFCDNYDRGQLLSHFSH